MADGGTGATRYEWTVLQTGELPLRPDHRVERGAEHRCTSVLIWPAGEQPGPDNTLLADPCFSEAGLDEAGPILDRLNISLGDVGWIFVTHPHWDHCPSLPEGVALGRPRPFDPGAAGPLAGARVVGCPGHEPSLEALVFPSAGDGQVWIVGDAILDEPWLRAWGYYWPNRYAGPQIVRTWQSVAAILSGADVVVPGHGPPIPVTPELLEHLIAAFPTADCADNCPEVAQTLRSRLEALRADRPAEGRG
jgi:glyoxylase-like metal-dependent hydrolase (beta-lactamase superfamily II)